MLSGLIISPPAIINYPFLLVPGEYAQASGGSLSLKSRKLPSNGPKAAIMLSSLIASADIGADIADEDSDRQISGFSCWISSCCR